MHQTKTMLLSVNNLCTSSHVRLTYVHKS